MTTGPGEEGPRPVETVELALEILDTLATMERAGVTDLAHELDRSKSGVYRHLETLRAHGLLTKTDDGYRLGYQFVTYGQQAKNARFSDFAAVREQLASLASKTGEFVQLMVEDQGYGVYLLKVGGENAIGSDYEVGETQHLHASAAGKAILAHLPRDRLSEIVNERGLPGFTGETITDIGTLTDEMETVRDRGFAFSDEETARGIRAVGTPVLDRSGRVLGSISVSGPVSRLTGEYYREELPRELQEVANVIEISHNYHS